jgi:hypothetical protein
MIAYAALHENNIPRARSFCTDSLRGNQKLGHTTGILACLLAFTEIETASRNETLAEQLYGFVKIQLEKESLQLMEPDDAALKMMEKKFPNMVDKTISELMVENVIKELKLGI